MACTPLKTQAWDIHATDFIDSLLSGHHFCCEVHRFLEVIVTKETMTTKFKEFPTALFAQYILTRTLARDKASRCAPKAFKV